MALSSSVLSAAMRANLLADLDPETGIDTVTGCQDAAALTAFCDRIAAAVVAHIQAAAVVSGTIAGVAAPDISGGAVTGTCSGTVA